MGARETALNALIACRKSGAWSNGVLKEYIQRDRLDSRDAGLATRLCYGVLQNRQKLDFYLKQLLTGKLKDLHPVVRDILHLGLYQIYELDKIPDSAAVNESVTLAKKYNKNPKAASLVNGVLRNAVRTQGQLKEPVSYADKYSHPDELISLLKANLPKGKLESMLIANNASPETVVQVNTLRTTIAKLVERLEQEGVCARPHRLSGAVRYRQSGKASFFPGGPLLCAGPCRKTQCPVCKASQGRDPGFGLLLCPRRKKLCSFHCYGRERTDHFL